MLFNATCCGDIFVDCIFYVIVSFTRCGLGNSLGGLGVNPFFFFFLFFLLLFCFAPPPSLLGLYNVYKL